jgi:MarR family
MGADGLIAAPMFMNSSGSPGSWPSWATDARYLLLNLRRQQETGNTFPESDNLFSVANWTFLTPHGRVLLLVAHDPGVRLRDIAASLDITERSAFGIITDLVEAGYVVKEKDGRRNRYHIQAHLPLPEPTARERTVGEVLALLTGTDPTVTRTSEKAAT